LRQQIVERQTAALAREIDVQRKVSQILTPEQRAKAREALNSPRAPRARR
jgi:Spy/CpxP family protein refolding chaperone